MKKIFLLAAMVMTAYQVFAASVDEPMARTIAQRFLNSQIAAGRMMAPAQGSLKLAHVQRNSHDASVPVYYIFNTSGGYIVVSGDDRAREILAFGDHPLDVTNMPANMRYWLSLYQRQLEYLQAHPDLQVEATSLQSPQRANQSVTPLLTANWSQNAPYWNECPVFGTDTCYTGCPATSLSMVFHYWKYPKHQTAAVPAYVIPTYGVELPELPPTTFDWTNMLDNYAGGQYNDEQAAAVAHLMRYIGQVEQMDYTISGSGAYGKDILRAVQFFEYDQQSAQLLFKTDDLGYANYSDAQWGALMQAELTAGRPIVYCAYENTTGSGHAFNVDGYDAVSDTYHINWGWNGRGNGYCAMNAFTYNESTFGTAQQMVIGIQPPEGYQNPRLQAYPSSIGMTAYVGKPSTATFSLKGTNLTGDVTLSLHDENGVFALSAQTVSMTAAEAGQDVVITYTPQAVGSHVATIVCTSQDADPLTITVNGIAPLEVYPPVLQPAAGQAVTSTGFRADWTDMTPAQNVASYSLEVYAKPDYILLEQADFSDLPRMSPTNQASHATDYLPQGWSFTGSEFNLEGGCIMPRRNSVITTDALHLKGYDKVTVEVTARSYGSWGDPSELTISTSLASETLALPFSYATMRVVLDCAEGDQISFKAGYYPMIQAIKIYAGDATSSASLKATESGDATYRLITDITATSYTIRDLAANGTYFYHVMAHYIDGSDSGWSDEQIVTLADGGHSYTVGDVNHDGVVGIGDVSALIDYLLGSAGNDVCATCANVDGQDGVSIADVSALIDLLLGGN